MQADTVTHAEGPEAILRARAEALAAPPTTDRQRAEAAIVMLIGESRVAVPMHLVRTVAAPGPVADIPRSGHQLVGARLIGGEVVALADLGPALGSPSDSPAGSRFVVVLDVDAAPLGVMADRVSTVEVGAGIASGEASPSGFVAGVTDEGVLLLDVEAVLADRRFMTAPVRSDVAPTSQAPTKGPS